MLTQQAALLVAPLSFALLQRTQNSSALFCRISVPTSLSSSFGFESVHRRRTARTLDTFDEHSLSSNHCFFHRTHVRGGASAPTIKNIVFSTASTSLALSSSHESSFDDQDSDDNNYDSGKSTPVSNPITDDATIIASPIITTTTTTTTTTNQTMALFTSPRNRATLWMAMSMALHFGGYEFTRSSLLTLFTSPATGFTQAYSFPLAMALVSPFSFILLIAYNRVLETRGPKVALRQSTIWSIMAIGLVSMAMLLLTPATTTSGMSWTVPHYLLFLRQWLVGLAFVFSNSYAHLLYNQHWSFLGSITASGATWFSSIAGLSSLASTFTGTMVGVLVPQIGLNGLLACTVVTLTMSLLCAEQAYKIAERYGFSPGQEMKQLLEAKRKKAQEQQQDTTATTIPPATKKTLIRKAQLLFARVPTLKALFCEVLTFQCMSTILNVCLVSTLKVSIPNDMTRATWTGRFYATMNAVSAVFQFILLPLGIKKISPAKAWRYMSIVPVLACLGTCIIDAQQLTLLAIAFFSTKCLDYSLRGVVTEMVYVPLDFESRFVGKELNGVFGNRLGKSGMSVLLSVLTGSFGSSFGIMQLTQLASVFSVSWACCTLWLSRLVAAAPPQLPNRSSVQAITNKNKESME